MNPLRHIYDLPQIKKQTCGGYLRYLGFSVKDTDRLNCPFRPGSDSNAFCIKDAVWFDHVIREGGHLPELALKMNDGDAVKAVRTLLESVGMSASEIDTAMHESEAGRKASAALRKVMERFPVSSGPQEVREYLAGRMVTQRTEHFFAFIPIGQLASVLTPEEIELTQLYGSEGKLIFLYFHNAEPVFYCTRSIQGKQFLKASNQDGVFLHTIWNIDLLYKDVDLVLAEGMFDCTSLTELEYSVVSGITCGLSNDQRQELLSALRFRRQHCPKRTLTICLDNDETGQRGARDLAEWLFARGIDVKVATYDSLTEKDINELHKAGKSQKIHSIINTGKRFSETVLDDSKKIADCVSSMCLHEDYSGVANMFDLLKTASKESFVSELITRLCAKRWNWRDIYNDHVRDVFISNTDVHVVFDGDPQAANELSHEVYNASYFTKNMEIFQRNPAQQIGFKAIRIPQKKIYWRVSRETNKPEARSFNLFVPSKHLLQTPQPGARIPPMFDKLLSNLAGRNEKEWLLNHMACYAQTTHKPRTIPVLWGAEGTGKNSLMSLFGEAIGGFVAIGNEDLDSGFNEYLLHPVLLLDELATDGRYRKKLKALLKRLINEQQSINGKFQHLESMRINNYVGIAANTSRDGGSIPVDIDKGDRRYSIIAGGLDRNLAHEEWFNYDLLKQELSAFMLYLLSRDIDGKAANIPLSNHFKQELVEANQNPLQEIVHDEAMAFVTSTFRNGTKDGYTKLQAIRNHLQSSNTHARPMASLSSYKLKALLENAGWSKKKIGNQWYVSHPQNSE